MNAARRLSAEIFELLTVRFPDGLSAGEIARRTHHQKARVLAVLTLDQRFLMVGVGRRTKWIVVEVPMPWSEIRVAVEEAPAAAQPVEEGEPVQPNRRARRRQAVVSRRIVEHNEVDEAARMFGLPITRSAALDHRRPWRQRPRR